jgi:hypothetical protein
MILLCNEQDQSMIWIDPRGRQLKRTDMVLLVFRSIAEWDEILGESKPVCIQALRTKNKVLPLDEAARLVTQRMRRLTQRKRRKVKASKPGGSLLKEHQT